MYSEDLKLLEEILEAFKKADTKMGFIEFNHAKHALEKQLKQDEDLRNSQSEDIIKF